MLNALEKYERMLRFQHKSKTTIKSYSANLKCFLFSIQKVEPTEEDIVGYLDALLKKDIEKSTWNQIMYSIQRYYSDLLGNAWIDYIKKFRVTHKIKQIPPKDKILEAIKLMEGTEYDTIEEVMQKKVALLVFYDGQHRISELQTQKVKDIDFNTCRIIIRNGKGDKEGEVEVSEITINFIKEYLNVRAHKENPYLFSVPDSASRYRSESYLYGIVKEAGRLVGYENWHPHKLRASGSRHRFDVSGDLIRSCCNLRHSKITTSIDYLNLKPQDIFMSQNPRGIELLRREKG